MAELGQATSESSAKDNCMPGVNTMEEGNWSTKPMIPSYTLASKTSLGASKGSSGAGLSLKGRRGGPLLIRH